MSKTEIESLREDLNLKFVELTDTMKCQISIEIERKFNETNLLIEKLFTKVSYEQMKMNLQNKEDHQKLQDQIDLLNEAQWHNSHFAKWGFVYLLISICVSFLLAIKFIKIY